jgi:leucyl/phenylalanyl-tRNA--protein transferase
MDKAFNDVIQACAGVKRSYGEGTWITAEMKAAYCELHRQGYAHSVEAWQDEILVGGLYGIAIGRAFFGESMFSLVSNASKVAFVTLVENIKRLNFSIIDCQVRTDHLIRFGAREIPRHVFLEQVDKATHSATLKR